MLKDVIRQLVSNTDSMSMFKGGQLQFAGVTVEEQRALMGELKDKESSKSGYMFTWN